MFLLFIRSNKYVIFSISKIKIFVEFFSPIILFRRKKTTLELCDYEVFSTRVSENTMIPQSQPTRNVIFLLFEDGSCGYGRMCVLCHVRDEYNSYQLSFTRLAIVQRMDHKTGKCDTTETCRCLLQMRCLRLFLYSN